MDSKISALAARSLPLCFFTLVFLFYTFPMGLSDFWWHMNTGRWIWEHLTIPSVDQFTYTYARDDDLRRVVISRAYYLGQLSYYFLYYWFGIWGLLLYKAALLTTPLWLLWRLLLMKSVDWRAALVFIAPLPFLLYRFDELRPHIFSFIGALLVLLQLEVMVMRLRQRMTLGNSVWLLPLTMLLWANLHRGFVVGWVLLGVYGVYEAWCYHRAAPAYARRENIVFWWVLVLSFAVSLLNPNGADALLANFTELGGPFMGVIDEYFPLYKYAQVYHAPVIFYGAAALVAGLAAVLLRYRRQVSWSHGLLFLGFAYEGFATFRFSYFQGVILPALVVPYLAPMTQLLARRRQAFLWGGVILSSLALAFGAGMRSALWYGPLETAYFPEQAVAFVRAHRPPGQIFNAFEFGGYLGWELYPEYPVFIDQRNLDYAVYQEYSDAWRGGYRDVFTKYDINTVVFYSRQPVLQRPPPLVGALLDDDQWAPVFADHRAIVFVRVALAGNLRLLDRTQVRAYLQQP